MKRVGTMEENYIPNQKSSERFGNLYFHNYTQGRISFDEVVVALFDFIRQDPKGTYRVIIGTDSKGSKDSPNFQSFVTAIIVHKIGYGARYFWRKTYQKISEGFGTKFIRRPCFLWKLVGLLWKKLILSQITIYPTIELRFMLILGQMDQHEILFKR